ncbi:hypothetical protein ACPWR0_07480 [Pandoraea pneumonica]|uniref:hypothetical protein n=1 Tax=Pandoraea pneumonica TaxID=2508299 RepID=UPI003CEA2650
MASRIAQAELRRFNDAALEATKQEWARQVGAAGVFNLDYGRTLDSIANHMNYENGGGGDHLAYGIFKKNQPHACAVVHVVYTRKPAPTRGWLKMMEVRLSPELDLSVAAADSDALLEVLQIYAASISGTFALQAVHPSNVVKIYGRNASLLQLLVALVPTLQASNFNAKMEGRWLVIPKRETKKG